MFKDEKTEFSTGDVSIVMVVVLVAVSGTNEDISLPVEVEDNDEYSLEFDR